MRTVVVTLLLCAGPGYSCGVANAQSSLPKSRLPLLSTAREAHTLTTSEAARGYPVRLHAVVTNYFTNAHNDEVYLWVHDHSGGIFVSSSKSASAPVAGSVVEITGVSDPGNYAPIVGHATVSILGHTTLPSNAPLVSLGWLRSGAGDGQWVQVEGVVHSVEEQDSLVILQLAMEGGVIAATTPKEAGADYSKLVDSRILMNANASPLFNSNHQTIGARLLFPSLAAVRVLEQSPDDPFRLPMLAVDRLAAFDGISSISHRVHIQGRVTLQWLGTSLCVSDATHGICAESAQKTPLAIGDLVDLVGFQAAGGSGPVLTDAIFKKTGNRLAFAARRITAEQAFHSERDADLIQIEGKLIGRDLAAADTTLMLSSDKFIFAAILPHDLTNAETLQWRNGSKLRVTGICSVQVDAQSSARVGGMAVPKSFRVLLRSPQDVVVIEQPSWWTPMHAGALFSSIVSVTLAVLGWVVMLRRRVDQQTAMIRESEERFRHMAQHDALTGLATRLLLHDRLNMALLRAKRRDTAVALLMLDLDKFKAINDTLGHDAGDRTLCVTAERLLGVVRETDTVARMGGDEFIILMPEVEKLEHAHVLAARVVAALCLPIQIAGRDVPISASVGVGFSYAGQTEMLDLLKAADIALYNAKARGRNCFETSPPDAVRETAERQLQAGHSCG